MNEVVLFKNKDFGNIRVLGDHLKPMFVAKDVAEALGYTNTNDAIQKFCKGVAKRYPLSTDGGIQNVRVIYEPDLYRLIFGSKLKSAIKFQDWVFEEVLPSIRKQGFYNNNQKYNKYLTDIMEEIYPKLPDSDYMVNIAIIKDAYRNPKEIFKLNYLVDNRTPQDPNKQ
ncbi:putative antirepressor%2C BRO family [Campylobacter hyointestinalis subsp. hyointestinalis]|uniref:Antirepressor, BRO family n=1 Tax=Campylobacter hyointestinalis subsp. hyointestinalis TaxID=91352 RepID=A0A9W5ES47_CAMHY|nr:BRO family protein [Campylobacter hyointestinalis]CUU79078.1 putative antirepressor%2C BRO family [Campylobacter hyointestinalis subsp. hyointestinalis]